jgi:hypothetical protein
LALPVAQYMPQLDALVRQMASAQTGALTGGGGVTSLNSLVGALNITAGANITVTLSGSNIQIASTGAAGGGLTIGTTPIAGGAANHLLYDNGGTLVEASIGTGLLLSGGVLSNTVTAPTGANPSATGGPTAINGSAATFMRSDAAPAIQLGSATQKGIVQVDGTTITAASGVISAAGGGGLTIGTTPISGGHTGGIVYDNGGTLEEASTFLYVAANKGVDTQGGGGVSLTSPASDNGGNSRSIAIGLNALAGQSGSSGYDNIAIGYSAVNSTSQTSSAIRNIGIGYIACGGFLNNLTSGRDNIMIGYEAGYSIQNGTGNIGIGSNALSACYSGSNNFCLGLNSGSSIGVGTSNVGLGNSTLHAATNDNGHVAIGYSALPSINGGQFNVAIGYEALFSLASGNYNTAIGQGAGLSLSGSEQYNTLIGCWFGAAGINSVIALSDGQRNVRLDYNYTISSLWTFAAPIAVPGAANPVLTTTSAVTSGAGSGAGTLTNAPSAGNPSKWIPFNDNGTTRYIPAWNPP